MLGAKRLRELVASGDVGWDGGIRGDALLLTLGSCLQGFRQTKRPVDPYRQSEIDRAYGPLKRSWKSHVMRPRGLVLCQTREAVRLAGSVAGLMTTLGHLARLGLTVELSPYVAAGFEGYLTLEVFNASPLSVRLRPGMPVARLVLFEVEGPAADQKHLYGEDGQLGSLYGMEFEKSRGRRLS